MKKVLIIDDEEKLRKLLARLIGYEGYEVLEAAGGAAAFRKMEQKDIDVVLCDVKLPDINGLDLSLKIKEQYPEVEIIMLTAYGNIPDGVQAIKNGAFDYITKGDDNNKIIPLIRRAAEKIELARRVKSLEKQLGDRYSFDNIIGDSPPLAEARNLAARVAAGDTTVLLTGETGTGKEVFANAIHMASNRRYKNFIAINCAAFSHELLESEFFGHTAGAFSGATRDRKGIFEEANNGTIFLDEIGEMATDLQAKLLRVIETGEYYKVGDSKVKKSNVRIIAATNLDLRKEVAEGRFREDLFYRISVFQINLPPLRERRDDIEVFARYFLDMFSIKTKRNITGMSSSFITALKQYEWTGNIRELRNVIERCCILANGPLLTPDLLPLEIQQKQYKPESDPHQSLNLSEFEKMHIIKVLNHTGGNKTKTAELLGVALTTLYRKMAEYNL
ncbi:MAG TPA: sigma-54 dependent transcriptional regulator [Lentimicrobium sp.]|nr:sigma-54 dependent transcriptional regulator [Lentimicrobium sp.]